MASEGFEKVRNGRKFRMALYCLFFVTAGLLAAASAPAVGVLYATYVASISGIFAIYCGGNIGNKYVLTRPKVEVLTDRRQPDLAENTDGPGPVG